MISAFLCIFADFSEDSTHEGGLFHSALFFEHRDLEFLDAFLYIILGVVVLTYDVGLDALRVLVEVNHVVQVRALNYECSGCAAPVESGNRDSPLTYLVYAVYIVYVKVSPSVCLDYDTVSTPSLSNNSSCSRASYLFFVSLRGSEYQHSHQVDSRVFAQKLDQRISEVMQACFFC